MSSSSDKSDKYPPASRADRHASDGSTGGFLELALQHHRAGRIDEAKAGYHQVLRLQPENADALHMLGVIAYQDGSYDEAIALITRAASSMPGNAGLYINLGNALQAKGQLEDAVAAFRKSIEFAPGNEVAHNNLGNALREQGKHDAAVAAFHKALLINGHYTDAHVNLAITYQAMGDEIHAAQSYERAVELDPEHKPAAHMLAALRGEVTDAAPREHVSRLFDGYAGNFDHHLVDTLGYSMPSQLRAEVDRQFGESVYFQNAIDLGCGTGLVGAAFRDICGTITGVDLSSRMVDQARERKVYDELYVADIITALEAGQDNYDLLICADAFPYIGNVGPLFAAVSSHSRRDALFAFSTELDTGEKYILRASGRYAHSQSYLRSMSEKFGFTVITMRTENLRKQRGEWITGDLVIMQYR